MLDTLVRQRHLIRLTVAAAVVITTGCTGLIESGGDGNLTPEEQAARAAWTGEAQPVLETNCAACHNGSRQNIAFLEGADPLAQRDDLIGYEPLVVNLTAPQSSRLLTKGLHEGPAFTASQASAVLQWIQKEKDAAGATGGTGPSLETPAFRPIICVSGAPGTQDCMFNSVPLDSVGAPGASIRFTVQALGSGLYLSNMSLQPGPGGAYIEHPLFVSKPEMGNAKPDTIDRFFSVKMNVSPMASDAEKQIAGGTAAFVGFSASDFLSIYFKAVTPFKPEMAPPMTQSGCKALTQFEAIKANFNTAVAGAANNCNNCHGGNNAGATGAMSTQGIGQTGAALQQTCNQILIRVNLTTPDASGIFLAPDPAATHPFRFNAAQLTTFKNNVMPWITAERTAP